MSDRHQVKVTLNPDDSEIFQELKKWLGVDTDAEVVRVLLNTSYENLMSFNTIYIKSLNIPSYKDRIEKLENTIRKLHPELAKEGKKGLEKIQGLD